MKSKKITTNRSYKPVLKTVSEIISVYPDGGCATKEQQDSIVDFFTDCQNGRKFTKFDSSAIQICLWFTSSSRNGEWTFYFLPEFRKQIIKRGFEVLSPEEQKQYGDIVGNFALTNATGLMTLNHNKEAEEIIDYLLEYFNGLPECKNGIVFLDAIALKGMLRDLSGDSDRALYYYCFVLGSLGEKNIPPEMSLRISALLKEKHKGEQKIFA